MLLGALTLWILAPIANTCEEGKVFVVGAGIAGLVAASSLQKFGCDVTVLEALDRLGGRTHTFQTGVFAGTEEGAHWIHGGIDNVPLSTLLDMYKVGQVRVGGDDDYEGSRSRLLLLSPENLPLSAAERDLSFDLFESARSATDIFARGTLSEKDVGISVADVWHRALKVNYSAYGQAILDWHQKIAYEQDSGASIQELSALGEYVEDYTDFYPKRSAGLEKHGDAYVQGGYSTLVQRLAAGLDVRLQSPVSRIKYSNESVALIVNGTELRGASVILTASVGALQAENIAFEPALPSWKREALKRLGMGNVAKVLVKLSQLVPRLDGVYSLGRLAPRSEGGRNLISYCIWDELEHSRPILECFLGGQQAISAEMMDAEALKRQVTSELDAAIGSSVVEEVMITKWSSNPFIRGAWSYARVNSSAKDFDALAHRVGKLHFAGEATCRLLWGNVHAAVVSGARAAHELLHLERNAEESWPLFKHEILQLCTHCPAGSAACQARADLRKAVVYV